MNNIYFSPDAARATYERIVQTVADSLSKSTGRTVTADDVKRAYKVMPSVLKMAMLLDPGKSQYVISPRKGVDPLVPNAILLDQNDFFAIDGLGIRLGRAAWASGTGTSNQGNYPLLTYPDPIVFSYTSTSLGSEVECLQTLVNGSLGIQVNGDFLLDPTAAQEFFHNPMRAAISGNAFPQFGPGDDGRGIFPLTPQLILDASADNGIVINLANGVKGNIDGNISATTTASATRNFLYIMAYGWKIKNLSGAGATCDRA